MDEDAKTRSARQRGVVAVRLRPVEIRDARPEHFRAIGEAERQTFADPTGYSPWRRRRLASALIAHSLTALRERGMTERTIFRRPLPEQD